MIELCKRNELLKFLCDEYIDSGYLYSGMWPYTSLREKGFSREAIYDLVNQGLLQKRNCDGFAFELVPFVRQKLLSDYFLASKWFEKAGPAFLNSIKEEVSRVHDAVLSKQHKLPESIDDAIQSKKHFVLMDGDTYASSLYVWGDSVGELWDPNKKDYIEAKELPEPLQKAHDNLWEVSGDDYLVEFCGNFYYMIDHVYNEDLARSFEIERWDDLYDIAFENAANAANHDALQDAIVLVAKKSVSLGPMHVVSVLIRPEETKEKVDIIRQFLSDCMLKKPEKRRAASLDFQIQSASARPAEQSSMNKAPEKEFVQDR